MRTVHDCEVDHMWKLCLRVFAHGTKIPPIYTQIYVSECEIIGAGTFSIIEIIYKMLR